MRAILDIPELGYTINGMYGWSLVLSREVNGWLCGLDDATFGRVAYHLDLLRDRGAYLDRPGSALLRPGEPIRQLTIPDGRRTHRLTYCLDGRGLDGRGTIVALTVRRWWRPARWELHRARDAIARHHGHHRHRRARAPGMHRRRRPSWRGLSGWWRRTVRGECGMDRPGPGRERA
jgi:hypothetical protein